MPDLPTKNSLQLEVSLWGQQFRRVMGLDEVGRGCLSGPVVAAGVILPPDIKEAPFPDSKQIGSEERKALAREIRDVALFSCVREVWPAEIDRINILQASIKAMLECAESEEGRPDYLLVDGNRFTSTLTPHRCITGGDRLSASIGAASILAKVYRDRLMAELHEEYPYYGWDRNVGYPTREHYRGLSAYGFSPYHRRSFNLRTDRPVSG